MRDRILSLLAFLWLIASQSVAEVSPNRFIRGNGGFDTFSKSIVLPLSGQKGVGLDAMSDNLETFGGNLPWQAKIHRTERSHAGFGLFKNAIVSFGGTTESRLQTGRRYSFGMASGFRYEEPNVPEMKTVIRIKVYRRSDLENPTSPVLPINIQEITIPRKNVLDDAAEWEVFARDGYTKTVVADGLTTIVQPVEFGTYVGGPWDTNVYGSGSNSSGQTVWTGTGAYVISHQAANADNLYQVELRGYARDIPLVFSIVDDPEEMDYGGFSAMYTLDFEVPPPWQTTLLESPHFDGEPLPPAYVDKSVEQLLADSPLPSAPVLLAPANCLAVDTSTELRSHPMLDQLALDLGNDPIGIANYVLNEIELVDAIGLNSKEQDFQWTVSKIRPPGVNRGALGVMLERQGSPIEQCALLVYLLRKAGVPAAFMFPQDKGVTLLDSQVSGMLGIQVRGAPGPQGHIRTTHLIDAYYPWVAAHVDGQWRHIFPWLKDVEVIEGRDLWAHLPPAYDNASKWLRGFLFADSAIRNLGPAGAPPSELFPRFITEALRANHPELSLADIGVRHRQRKQFHSKWDTFPRPFATDDHAVTKESLAHDPKFFDTMRVQVSSQQDPAKRLDTGLMRMADLLHRRLQLRFEKTGVNLHNAVLTLSPFHYGVPGQAGFRDDPTLGKRQALTLGLAATDLDLLITVTHEKSHQLSYSAAAVTNFLELKYNTQVVHNKLVKKGDLTALCFNVGRVTDKMVNLHAQDFWRLKNLRLTNPSAPVDPEISPGVPAHLLGMSYYRRLSSFQKQLAELTKVRGTSDFHIGLVRFAAERVAGQLPNDGEIIYQQPVLDMFSAGVSAIYGVNIHADAGNETAAVIDSFSPIMGAEGSAQEAATINSFFGTTDAVSTTRLLQLAHQRSLASGPPIQELNHHNYATKGDQVFGGMMLKDADPGIWSQVENSLLLSTRFFTSVYMTPGRLTNDSGSFTGVGAFIYTPPGSYAAIVSGNLNGGYGPFFPFGAWNLGNFGNLRLGFNENGDVVIEFERDLLAPADSRDEEFPKLEVDLASDLIKLDPNLQARLAKVAAMYGYTLTGNPAVDRAALARLIADKRLQDSKNSDRDSYFKKVLDPVNVVTGEFYIDAVDLSLNGPMPLEIRRNYSSQNIARNEFGYGWKISYFPCLTLSLDEEVIHASELDGSTIAYRRSLSDPNRWEPRVSDNPELDNINGRSAGGLTNLYNARIEKVIDGGTTFYILTGPDLSIRTFEVQSFPLPGPNGLVRSRPYLTEWKDDRGNFLVFEYGGTVGDEDYGRVRRIVASNGNFLGFYYNSFGQIEEAYTGDGRRIYYEYDGFGDLRRVIAPDNTVTEFEYEHDTVVVSAQSVEYSTHLLTRETKPEGRILENIYDAERRVIEQKATAGNDMVPVRNARFTYTITSADGDPITGQTVIEDAYDRTTTYVFEEGCITSITDPLNLVIQNEWYAPGDATAGAYPRSLKRCIDKRGLITDYKYDARGSLTEVKLTGDLTGGGVPTETSTTTSVFNALGLLEETTEPTGVTTKQFYEDVRFPTLVTRVERWKSGTLLSRDVLEYGEEVLNADQASYGLLLRHTAAAGTADQAVREWSYTWRGFPIAETKFTGTTDPNLTRTILHNDRGELVEETDAIGRRSSYAYDNRGNRIWREVRDETGVLLAWQYDYFNGNGELAWSDGAKFNPEDYTWIRYDGAGRPAELVRWRSRAKADGSGVEAETGTALYSTITNRYDLLGSLTHATDPLGNVTVMTYDDNGRMVSRTAHDGTESGPVLSTESFAYEPGGAVSLHTDAMGAQTHRLYTSTGRIKFAEKPDGAVLSWRYYLDGRIHRAVASNGSYWETAYDDVARTVTRQFKRADGTVLATEQKGFDRRGNVVTETNVEGHTSTSSYDGLNRPKVSQGPAGTITSAQRIRTYIYDNCGKVVRVRNALNEEEITTFDAVGRPILEEVKNAASQVVRKKSYQYSVTNHAMTATSGSGGQAISKTVYIDAWGSPVLKIAGDGSYRRFVFDVKGRGVASFDELGQATLRTYDALDRVRWETLPGGAATEFVYNDGGDLLERRMPGGLTWRATYDNARRQIVSEELRDGAAVTRHTDYAYYQTGPFTGMRHTVTDARDVICTYTYDDFLRIASAPCSGPQPWHNINTTYIYDRRNLPTEIHQSSPGNAAGPATSVFRTYDAYGQMASERIEIGGVTQRELVQAWNGAGQRSSLGLGTSIAIQGAGTGTSRAFDYRADGLLTAVTVGGAAYETAYGDNALVTQRTSPARTLAILDRDENGRIEEQQLTVGGSPVLTEQMVWRKDGKISSYTADRSGAGEWDEIRQYGYNSRGQLLTETYGIGPGQEAGFNYQFDGGTAGTGPGVRTLARSNGIRAWRASVVGQFARIQEEATNSASVPFTATGFAKGAAQMELLLDGVLLGNVSFTPGSVSGAWSSNLTLSAGPHRLDAKAEHPSGYTSQAARNFTVSGAEQLAVNTYDSVGNVATRTLPGGRLQTLKWDALSRLISVIERDASDNGFDWSAVYDPVGRRLATTHTPVSAGAPVSAQTVTLDSWYDPQVEFLEIGIAVNGVRNWKVYGPDLAGGYGSLQGIGGLEAVVRESDGFTQTCLSDQFGNVVAHRDGLGAVQWNAARVNGYGALPGSTVQPLNASTDVASATLWRSKRIDETGLYYLGARYYEPQSGRFLSPDPLGHASSANLYDYANGDPVNFVDPDGRWVKSTALGTELKTTYEAIKGFPKELETSQEAHDLWAGIFAIKDFLGDKVNKVLHPIDTVVGIITGIRDTVAGISSYLGAMSVDPAGTLKQTWNNIKAGLEEFANNPDAAPGRIVKGALDIIWEMLVERGRKSKPDAGAPTPDAPRPSALTPGPGGMTNAELVQELANRADAWGDREGLGIGGRAGTLKHSYAEELLDRVQRRFGDRQLSMEVPYLNGQAGQTGKGSIRLDVVEGPVDNPTAIWDYKFGGAELTPERVQQIRQVGQFGPNVPINAVHPQ
jgi:RHS repeat-associated protein